jgi:hypothetical protein
MKNILVTVGRVITGLVTSGLTFESSDDFENDFSPTPEDIEGHEVFVGDDGERDQWEVVLRVTPKEGINIHDVVSSVLGPPTKVHPHGVTNYEPLNVLVVVGDDWEVMFYQDYEKV